MEGSVRTSGMSNQTWAFPPPGPSWRILAPSWLLPPIERRPRRLLTDLLGVNSSLPWAPTHSSHTLSAFEKCYTMEGANVQSDCFRT